MSNRETSAAWKYHDGTKHSLARLQGDPHFLDWDNKPLPFKVYPQLDAIALPRDLPASPVPAIEALQRAVSRPGATTRPVDLLGLARVLHFSAGITRKKTYPGGQEHHFRAAACTGALYHIDLYVICGDLPGLAAGVYHFGPHDFSLYRLRAGDHRATLVAAAGEEASMQHAPVIVACASTYWRNAWKYRSRAYRHCFWDSGTILANLFAVAAADDIPAALVCGFVDQTVSELLGLEPQREGPLGLVALGSQPEPVTGHSAPQPALRLETLPLSSHQVDYPQIREMQAASSLLSPAEAAAWRETVAAPLPASLSPAAVQPPGRFALPPPAMGESRDSIDMVIVRRGSTRRFAPLPIDLGQLSAMLAAAAPTTTADFGRSVNDIYLIVNAVDGLTPGTYVYRSQNHELELLRAGQFREQAGHLGLGQELPRDASVNFYFLCDLAPVLARFGNRGYRVAQLDAAVAAGKLYLAAYALRLGASGLTFFDDEVTAFFSPHASGKSVMFLMAVGRAKRSLPLA